MTVFSGKNKGKKLKNARKNIDRAYFLAYNRIMEKKSWSKREYALLALRIVLIIASVFMTAFIFSNSIKNGSASTEQSSKVVEVVQQVAAAIAPDSKIANATGEAYDRLHDIVRKLAHVSEFTLLGALYSLSVSSFSFKKRIQIFPCIGVILVGLADEILQSFSPGRAFEWKDILLDTTGGFFGVAIAVLCVWCGCIIYRKTRKHKE